MDFFQAVLLGVVQGFAEFLPVSSSGHLVLLRTLLDIEAPLAFDVFLHLGSLSAAVFVFWKDIMAIVRNPFGKTTLHLLIATAPAVAAGFFLKDFLERSFNSGLPLAAAFALTGILLIYADRAGEGKKSLNDVTVLDALIIGCMQAVGIPPGVSRSGAVLAGALGRGLSREAAPKFVFLMSVPVILGAGALTGLDVIKDPSGFAAVGFLPLSAGFAAALITGFLSIKFMLRLIRSCRLKYFSFYVFALAAFVLIKSIT